MSEAAKPGRWLVKLKLNADGSAVVQDGKPVYVGDDGKEIAFDAPGTVAAIARLNAEAKDHRVRAEGLAAQLEGFKGIDDPTKALKALQMVANLDEKKLVDAGERDRAVAEAVSAIEAKYAPIVKRGTELEAKLSKSLIGDVFNRSKFVAEKFAAKGPAGVEIARALFGSNFKVEGDDAVVAYINGAKVYSRSNPGALASPDEALEIMVDSYPYKEHILQGANASGGGAAHGNGNPLPGNNGTKGKIDGTPQERAAYFASNPKYAELTKQ